MTSQLFESASLEEALAEVRDTVGPHAKIVRAEKVRRGGIAGFFTKESFVLAVEHNENEAAGAYTSDSVRTVPAPQQVSWTETTPTDAWNDPYQDRFSTPMDTPAAYSLDALADFADRSDDVFDSSTQHAVTEVPVSTETPLFGQVLRDVSRATALDLEVPAGPRWDGRMLDLDAPYRSVMPLVSAPTAPATPPVVTYVPQQVAAPAIEAAKQSRDIPLESYPDAPAQQPWWQTLAEVAETQAAAEHARSTPRSIDLSTPRPTPPPPPLTIPVDDRLGDELFPPAPPQAPAPSAEPVTAQSRSTADLAAGLATINAALGPALLPGSVIAVVGHPGDANKVAARVAVAASADPFSIHIASHDAAALKESGLPTGRQVSSLDEAILRSRRWPSRPTPVVVVVDGRNSQWARTVLDAIEATTVLALPSPTHDDDEVRAWVAELGGVQALLVDDTCVATPEALALHGIPALRSPWSLESTRRPGAE
ncbi:hypothetical protein acdb102_25570 [Acidothermaceae bacterium B102]|nr:hypothetical protein acdb102_25570 [Acidothermaceae bacterium B102]